MRRSLSSRFIVFVCSNDLSRYYVVALFVLALAPRVLGLRAFFTVDERPYIERSVKFLLALLYGGWEQTFRGHEPAVIPMWGVSLGIVGKYLLQLGRPQAIADLKEFVWMIPVQPIDLDFLPAFRLFTVLVTSLSVVGVYLLARRLFDDKIALLSAVIMALDPFYLAHSRFVHMDALGASFMTLSFLSFLVYLWGGRSWRYVVFSGIGAGLACLTRSPSFSIALWVFLAAVVAYLYESRKLEWGRIRPLIVALALWAGVTAFTFAVLWPAMWVNPLGVLYEMIWSALFRYASAPRHEHFNYFMGVTGPDPGPLFYPVALLLRITPLTLVGFLGLIFLARKSSTRSKMAAISLLLYAVGFTAFMTLGVSKVDRYILSVFPAVDILAAVGLYELFQVVASRFKLIAAEGTEFTEVKTKSLRVLGVLCGSILVLQAGFSLPHYPYYLSYYNPLVGGARQAVKTLAVGWGEGLDEAARYLNKQENAKHVIAASLYSQQFAPFFVGTPTSMKSSWFSGDYVVLYLSHIQRGMPDPELLDYFLSMTPEHVVRLKGIDYASIYRVPQDFPRELLPIEHRQERRLGDELLFRGYTLDASRVEQGGDIYLDLYWQCLKPMQEDYSVSLKLLNAVHRVWGQLDGYPVAPWGVAPTRYWQPGRIYLDSRELAFLPGTPPGVYQLEATVYVPDSGRQLPPGLSLDVVAVPHREAPALEKLDLEHPLTADFGGIVRLLGYNLERRPGGGLGLTLFWQALTDMDQDYTVFVHLVDEGGNLWSQGDSQPADGFYPTTEWQEGELVRDPHDLLIPPEAPRGGYRLGVGLYLASTGERLPIADGGGDTVWINVE